MLEIGAEIPSTLLTLAEVQVDLHHYFRNRVGVLFGVPGAFVSSESDLASVLRDKAEALRNEVDFIGCLAINDPHVLKAWGQSLGVSDEYILISDYEGRFASRLGVLEESANLGTRIISFVIICYESRIHWFAVGDDISFDAIDQALIQRPELLKINRHLVHTRCLQFDSTTASLDSTPVEFRPCGPKEVQIAIEYTLLDEEDAIQAASQKTTFPLVPGRVFTGVIVAIGSNVEEFAIGDAVAVSYITDSCGICRQCKGKNPQYCTYATPTNNGRMRDGSFLLGGLAKDYVVDSRFVCLLPKAFRSPLCLPLFGPGLSVYSALKSHRNQERRGERLGIIGNDLWGFMANKVAVSMGFDVALIDPLGIKSTVSESEMEVLGSKAVPLADLNLLVDRGSFDIVIAQVRNSIDLNIILDLTKTKGKVILISGDLSDKCQAMSDIIPLPLIFSNRSVVGSCCGSPSELKHILQCEKLAEMMPPINVVGCDQAEWFLRHRAEARNFQSAIGSAIVVQVSESLE
eukprot:Gregarina_sp_Poly_1__2073@NODE_1547_length_3868_cov_102_621152_g1021_i0_p1_GENE_NODE_1547_length_3868_cov_102_621152_g1021_i0NODE_1547_length_3868_cov_102_621152_g1021_i0_p1_ORF_typecomplete_len518_score67_00ADH_N/PF08240_12/2_5e17Redoxin/PF08534_10/1_2e10Redoxin/PF08534_10/7_6e03Redoxin/PF08534_10/1_2e04ADH_zinc_N/PF00107_26/0_0051Glu_dehyd_C/PF16912_5/0_0112Hacid_dh_C/PF02826_19/0_872Hacid_dh_C/PF02826_19/9_6e02_NODE_1547_length_3868_cov_102_621152_g1021_i017443297